MSNTSLPAWPFAVAPLHHLLTFVAGCRCLRTMAVATPSSAIFRSTKKQKLHLPRPTNLERKPSLPSYMTKRSAAEDAASCCNRCARFPFIQTCETRVFAQRPTGTGTKHRRLRCGTHCAILAEHQDIPNC